MSKRIVVLGAAESGVGAAVLALKKGFDVFVSDMGAIKDNYKEMMQKYGIEFEEKLASRLHKVVADPVDDEHVVSRIRYVGRA